MGYRGIRKMEDHEPHHEKRRALSKSFYMKIYLVLGIALIIFALYNLAQTSSFNNILDRKLAEAKKAARPARIELVIVSVPSCEDCYDLNAVIGLIESTGVNVTSKKEVEFSSKNGQSLIDRYNIGKVPTVIVAGEINKFQLLGNQLAQISEEKNGVYVFTKLEPPFVDTETGKIMGKISLIHLQKEDCEECFNLSIFIDQLDASGLIFEEQRTISVDSAEGKNLVDRYNISRVPLVIMDEEAGFYQNIVDGWSQVGSIEEDGHFVMREISPPYYSVEEKSVKGLVSVIYLEDDSCEGCYDAEGFHGPIILRMGVVPEKEEKVDVSSPEGKALVEKYEIEKVPTLILEGDMEEYPLLVGAWKGVGTVESDGTYVFRSVELAKKTYKDLATGEVI